MRLIAFFISFLPTIAMSQGAATLVADDVTISEQEQLVASGNVEVFYGDVQLSATTIIYDRPSDRLIIEGPIIIVADDSTILTADHASLDPRLENGILQGARLVLDQQLQLAANQINRTDGRYSQLYKVAATSCQVCGTQAPLWDIRAKRVVHDELEKQLYYENATFRVRGVPIFWLPRMRLPDPTLDRATGFLIPRQRTTNQLGPGIKVPYFITLGDHRDLTLTPYLSSQTTTLQADYRQAFKNGDFSARAATSDDTLLPSERRSYIFAEGRFVFASDYQLTFDIEAVSDPAYLLEYGYSDKDRLDSAIGILRVTDASLTQANLTYYQTLRDDEVNASLPPFVVDASYEKRLKPNFGGTLTLVASSDAIYRYDETDGEAGRDVTRAGVAAAWQDQWVTPNGFVAGAQTGVRGDLYSVNNDSNYPTNDLRIVPSVGVTLRWPLLRQMQSGTSHMVVPTVALAWSDSIGGTAPNEDSTRSEFDQSNLFAASRFPGDDVIETGTRAAAGLTWTSAGVHGTTLTLSFGRVYRDVAIADFTPSSGLDESKSDWLLAGQISTPNGIQFEGRTLFDSDLELTRAASLIAWQNESVSLAAAYIWQAADQIEARPETVSEWTLETAFRLSSAWAISLDGRYDIAADQPVRAALGAEWRNECVTVDLSASRRYTSSTTVEPSTSYGLSVSLNGFSTGRTGVGPSARCTN